ncbi:hypothetical protein [Sphingomonas melonis]|uniref:Uncharacterized protein n=1 Tax=Sphingomonas melonis TaxID=152682 RepID=A0A7Y9FKF9_9SPHN|nr:hypothetical protein [Sphingomonas melonis]NYD88768.1 hypothetical protein [Sphingomonas melonis]
MSGITWGPEIAVDGKRPKWLGDYIGPLRWMNCDQRYPGVWLQDSSELNWGNYLTSNHGAITAIRLPADHPHYATLSHPTAPIPSEVGPEVVAMALSFVKEAADRIKGDSLFWDSFIDKARAIAALLPEPVDADLVEARRIAADHYGGNPWIAEGECDEDKTVQIALAAIKRGRALEAGDR